MAKKMSTEMSTEDANRRRVNLSPRERSQLIAEALRDAAGRMRFSIRGRRGLSFDGFNARPGQRILQIAFIVSFIVMVVIRGDLLWLDSLGPICRGGTFHRSWRRGSKTRQPGRPHGRAYSTDHPGHSNCFKLHPKPGDCRTTRPQT